VYRDLAMLLAAEPAAVRAFAARALGDAGNPEALETLEPLLQDTSGAVRLNAVAAVAECGAVDDMVPALAALIASDPSAEVRLLAVQSLLVIRDNPQAATALRTAAADVDEHVRAAARRALSSAG
jgi:HEAT repeat protein